VIRVPRLFGFGEAIEVRVGSLGLGGRWSWLRICVRNQVKTESLVGLTLGFL
jgi:hypothetical protein